MISLKDNFFSNTLSFAGNHKALLELTFGLAVGVYALGNFGGKLISWISGCCGAAKKADSAAKKTLNQDKNPDVSKKPIRVVNKPTNSPETSSLLEAKIQGKTTAKLMNTAEKPLAECNSGIKDEPYLPNDMLKKIFSEAGIQGLGTIACFNSRCNELVIPILRKKIYDEFCFNPARWNKYCGDGTVSNEEIDKAFKLLPQNINKILKSPCPAFPGKRVMDTHMLVWIPESINGKPLTINSFGELIKQQPEFANNQTGYQFILDQISQQKGGNQIKSGWLLMTTDVIPDSRKKSYAKQQEMVANLNKSGQTDYRVPKAGEAIVCTMADYLRSKKRLFSDDPLTYTRCQENVDGYQVVVGGFASSGLFVDFNCYDFGYVGVAGLREF